MIDIKKILDLEYQKRDSVTELSLARPDPLLVAKRYNDEKIALVCALFAYGNAKQIVQFLNSINFEAFPEIVGNYYYRFQKREDIEAFFKVVSKVDSLEEIFLQGYRKRKDIIDGLHSLIKTLRSLTRYESYGFDFLIGKPPPKDKISGVSPYKRWNMFLRWMVRKDNLDMGLWQDVDPADLIIPLDTHTFHVSRRLGLLKRKSYDLKAALLLTEILKTFDPKDPVKYDFVLYRLGQEKLVVS